MRTAFARAFALPSQGANRALRRDLLVVSALVFALLAAMYSCTLHWQEGWLRETRGYVIGRDFLNVWMAGRAAFDADPGRYYHPETYTAALEQMLGGRYMQQWSYPPMLLLLAAPFGLLPYHLAYALWTVLGVGLLWRVLRLYCPDDGWPLALLLSPAALLCFLCGQNAFFTTAALLAAWHWRMTRPWLAGLLIGLLSVKPQLALMVPIVLLAERNWRCIAAAAITVLGLVGAVAALYGVELLVQYWQVGMPAQAQVLREPAPMIAALMPTLFIQLWMLGLGDAAAMKLQLMCAAAMAVLLYRVCRRPGATETRLLLFTLTSLLATPYLLSYDLLPVSFACLWFLRSHALSRGEGWMAAALLFLPFVQVMAMLTQLPLTLVPVVGLLWVARRRSGQGFRADVAAAEPVRPVD